MSIHLPVLSNLFLFLLSFMQSFTDLPKVIVTSFCSLVDVFLFFSFYFLFFILIFLVVFVFIGFVSFCGRKFHPFFYCSVHQNRIDLYGIFSFLAAFDVQLFNFFFQSFWFMYAFLSDVSCSCCCSSSSASQNVVLHGWFSVTIVFAFLVLLIAFALSFLLKLL